jgi:hypothetical protein
MHLSEGPIDHAEETEGVIVHFSTDTRPVLLEVLDASEFLSRLTKITATAQPGTVMTLSQRITGKSWVGRVRPSGRNPTGMIWEEEQVQRWHSMRNWFPLCCGFRMTSSHLCPCGSGNTYKKCCPGTEPSGKG